MVSERLKEEDRACLYAPVRKHGKALESTLQPRYGSITGMKTVYGGKTGEPYKT